MVQTGGGPAAARAQCVGVCVYGKRMGPVVPFHGPDREAGCHRLLTLRS